VGSPGRYWSWLRLACTAGLLVAGTPAVASAHPRLTRSEPSAAQRIANAVSVLRLWFNEKPEMRLTSISLADSAGRSVAVGAVEREPGDAFGVRASVTMPLAPGQYTVAWRTAASDGHPVRGSFSFVVLPAAAVVDTAVSGSTTGARARPVDSMVVHREGRTVAGGLYTAVRALTFASLVLLVGAVAFRYGVLSRAEVDADLKSSILTRAAWAGIAASAALGIAAILRLVQQQQLLAGELGPAQSLGMGEIVRSTRWGAAWSLQVGAAAMALGGFLVAQRSRIGWPIAAVAASILPFTPALAGHAASTARMPILAIVSDAAHVIAASGWMGGLFLLIVVAIPAVTASSQDSHRWDTIATLVNGFSPTALAFAVLLALTGVVAAWLHVGSVSALWTSGYGRTLVLKLAVLLPLVATGAYNWRRVRPSLGTPDATSRLRRLAGVELAVGLLVICITAVLVATEPPLQ
jgi:copper transport protein